MEISISGIKLFKACRRAYFFKYIENLVPIEKFEALEVGKNYHKRLEALYNGEELEQDFSKESAMVEAYKKYIYPHFKVKSAENKFEYDLGNEHILHGITDGLTEDGFLVEHKTKGSEITEQYEYDLMWDEQILAYMLATNTRKVFYTVIRKPTIRIKKNETEEEFYQRMIDWYDEDTESKIRLLEIERTDDEVEQFKKNLDSIMLEMDITENQNKYSQVISDPYYRNTCHCNMYGRRCEYSGICLHYDSNNEYVEFERRATWN